MDFNFHHPDTLEEVMEWEDGLGIMECLKIVKNLLFLTSFLEEVVRECLVGEEVTITGVGEEKDNKINFK